MLNAVEISQLIMIYLYKVGFYVGIKITFMQAFKMEDRTLNIFLSGSEHEASTNWKYIQ